MKIYTKKGDRGETSLIGGTRVPKHHLRIESYGTIDELNSWIGLLRDQPVDRQHKEILKDIQETLFVIGSQLAADPEHSNMKLPEMQEEAVALLEREIDRMQDALPTLKHFILPGGHPIVSFCQVTRCVCRRAERLVVQVTIGETNNELIVKYMNRLSDYLFVLGRSLAIDLKATEYKWIPRG